MIHEDRHWACRAAGASGAKLPRRGEPVPVAVYKADGSRRFTLTTRCHNAGPDLVVLRGEVGRTFQTAGGVTYPRTATIEYFPIGRWWNVVSFFRPDTGALLRHFCNVMTPAWWEAGELRYVDLDLDVVKQRGKTPIVEDLDQFRLHARAWHYPMQVRRQALRALRELQALASTGSPPFTDDPWPTALAHAAASGLTIPSDRALHLPPRVTTP